MEDLVGLAKALEELRLEEEQLQRLVEEGEIRAFRSGRSTKFMRSDIERLKSSEASTAKIVQDLDEVDELLVDEDEEARDRPEGEAPIGFDVFVSYASNDRDKAEILAEALARRECSVFWDRTILPGEKFDEAIEAALARAKAVVVLWSEASVASGWVKDEARDGQERGVLLPVRIENVKPPLGFRGLQTSDLSDWSGDDDHPDLVLLAKAVSRLVAR